MGFGSKIEAKQDINTADKGVTIEEKMVGPGDVLDENSVSLIT